MQAAIRIVHAYAATKLARSEAAVELDVLVSVLVVLQPVDSRADDARPFAAYGLRRVEFGAEMRVAEGIALIEEAMHVQIGRLYPPL